MQTRSMHWQISGRDDPNDSSFFWRIMVISCSDCRITAGSFIWKGVVMMDKEKRKEEILQQLLEENKKDADYTPEEDWAEQAQEDMLDWIEMQGIYIRQ